MNYYFEVTFKIESLSSNACNVIGRYASDFGIILLKYHYLLIYPIFW